MEKLKTAKDLAWKAYLDMYMTFAEGAEVDSIRVRFENWWSEWFYDGHKESFLSNNERNVYIDGKRYIQAE